MFHVNVMEYLTDACDSLCVDFLVKPLFPSTWMVLFFDITSKSEGVGLRLVALFKCALASDPLQFF